MDTGRGDDVDRRAVAAAVVASVVAAVAVFAPWHRSGARVRSGAELVSVAEQLGLLDGAAWSLARVGWVAVPLIAAGAVAATVLGRWVVAAALSALAGATALLLGAIALGVPGAQWGPVVTSFAGALALGLVAVACRGLVRTT